MVAHLRNIDEELAVTVAGKLGIDPLPKAADAAMPTRTDLEPSPALSIIENGPESFAGRKVGVLIADGVDAVLFKRLENAVKKEGATMEVVAPKVGGAKASDGTLVPARHMIDGGPSVLFDAVALLLPEGAGERLAVEAAARDFVADAFAHLKFIAFTAGAVPLMAKAGVAAEADEGLSEIVDAKSVDAFIVSCRKLRLWAREPAVKNGIALEVLWPGESQIATLGTWDAPSPASMKATGRSVIYAGLDPYSRGCATTPSRRQAAVTAEIRNEPHPTRLTARASGPGRRRSWAGSDRRRTQRQISGGQFRHGSRRIWWRTEKAAPLERMPRAGVS